MLCWCMLRILLAVQQELDALPAKRIEVSHCELLGCSRNCKSYDRSASYLSPLGKCVSDFIVGEGWAGQHKNKNLLSIL